MSTFAKIHAWLGRCLVEHAKLSAEKRLNENIVRLKCAAKCGTRRDKRVRWRNMLDRNISLPKINNLQAATSARRGACLAKGAWLAKRQTILLNRFRFFFSRTLKLHYWCGKLTFDCGKFPPSINACLPHTHTPHTRTHTHTLLP